MADVFLVTVAGNLVTAIDRRPSDSADPPGTALEVGTQMAANFRESGRLDGSYAFADGEAARTFATLCLQFMKNLVEQRTRRIEALPVGFKEYRCETRPGADPQQG